MIILKKGGNKMSKPKKYERNKKKNENLGNPAKKTKALLEALVEKTGKGEEELIWEGVQKVWHKYNF